MVNYSILLNVCLKFNLVWKNQFINIWASSRIKAEKNMIFIQITFRMFGIRSKYSFHRKSFHHKSNRSLRQRLYRVKLVNMPMTHRLKRT